MTNMKSIVYTMMLSALLFQSCGEKKAPNTVMTSDTIPVKIMMLEQGSSSESVNVSGQFTTQDETFLSFKTGGVINRIFVKEGDAVKAGQLLATLHLTEINAQVSQARIAYEKAKRDNDRVANLYRDSVATLEQLQNSRTAADVAKQQYDAAVFNQGYSEIRANRNGFVLRKMASEGQIVAGGTPVLQINGAASGNWILKAAVSDREWSAIRKGDKAVIQTDVVNGKDLAAVVWGKSEGVDPVTGTLTVDLKLASGNTRPDIAAGLFGKASIQPSSTVTSWMIPYDAILDGDAGEGYVFITNDKKTAQKVKIRIGAISNGKVLVTGGLENAVAVITSGNAYLDDHSAITIVK